MKQKSNNRRKEKGKRVEFSSWDDFSVFLFVDKKQSGKSGNKSTQKSRYKKLEAYFNSTPFTRKNFNGFISALYEQKYSNSYINNFIKMGKLIDEYHKSNELKGYTYFKEKQQVYIETLTPDEIRQLAEITLPYFRNQSEINYRMKCITYLLGRTGCRIGEALGLKWDDVFTNYVLFRDTKNGDDRPVPIKPSLYTLLNGLPKSDTHIFNYGSTQEINLDLKKRAKACGIIKTVYCHLFRHSYISEMTKQKVPVSYIARIVGHRNLETTNRYTHANLADLEYMMSYHPLEKAEQTFEDVISKIKEDVQKLINTARISCSIEERGGLFVLQLKRL